MTQAPPTARTFTRRTLVRVLCWPLVWTALALFLYVILPCEPRVSFAVPEGKEVIELSGDLRFAVTVESVDDYLPPTYKESSLWNLETGELYAHLTHGEKTLTGIEFSPSSKFLIEHNDAEVKLLELMTGRQWSWKKVSGMLNQTFWLSPDEKSVAIIPRDAPVTVKILDMDTGRVRTSLNCEKGETDTFGQFSPDSKHFALTSLSRKLRLCELETGRSHVLGSSTISLAWFWFSPDSRTLAFYSDYEFILWDVSIGSIRFKIPTYSQAAEFSEDGTAMTTMGGTGAILWEVATGKKRDRLPETGSAFFLDASGSRLLTTDSHLAGSISRKERHKIYRLGLVSGNNVLWDMTTQPARPLASFKETFVHISPDGSLLARFGSDAIICMDTRTGQELGQIPRGSYGFCEPVTQFSPDNRTIALNQIKPLPNDPFGFYQRFFPKKKTRSGPSAECVELWDAPTCRRLAFLSDRKLHEFSADGKSLAVMNTVENTLEIWDVPPRKPLKKILIGALLLLLYILAVRWFCGRIRGKGAA